MKSVFNNLKSQPNVRTCSDLFNNNIDFNNNNNIET